MIDITEESLIPLSEVAAYVPSSRPGKRLNVATVWRWATAGVGGHRLETVKVGGSTYTSVEAVKRFVQQPRRREPQVFYQPNPQPRPRRAPEDADRQLRQHGA